MSRAVTNQIVTDSRNFFWSLIDLTGTYFLSDYVEEVKDYVGEAEAVNICEQRDALLSLCNKFGINFHGISCDVANEFQMNQRGGMNPNQVCDQLYEAGEWIQGMLSSEDAEQDHIKAMLFAIDEAINLIKTHAMDDLDNQLPPPPSIINVNL